MNAILPAVICGTMATLRLGLDPRHLVIGGGLCRYAMQDALSLGGEARMNFPRKLGGNWEWRMSERDMSAEIAAKFKELNELYLR